MAFARKEKKTAPDPRCIAHRPVCVRGSLGEPTMVDGGRTHGERTVDVSKAHAKPGVADRVGAGTAATRSTIIKASGDRNVSVQYMLRLRCCGLRPYV
jgi:hypothetical protein